VSEATPAAPTIAIVAERRHLSDRALVEARAAFERAGCAVPLVVVGGDEMFEVPTTAPPWEAVLSRGRDLAGLGILAAASALGVLAINSPAAIDVVRNKIVMQAVLLSHGLQLPKTWFADSPRAFQALAPDRFPLVVKPFDGDGSRGLALLTRPEDVSLLPPLTGRRSLYLAQEYLETDGWDLKLYGIGTNVWAVRKPSPVDLQAPGPATFKASSSPSELVPLDARLRDIALTCGRACGLELWGVDVAMTPHGPRVIEVNDFPTYSAVLGAGEAIARHVLSLIEIRAVEKAMGRDRMLSIVRQPT
jgi:ribosomal protein S6--L-glutamate ligase